LCRKRLLCGVNNCLSSRYNGNASVRCLGNDSSIPLSGISLHCSVLKAVRPEYRRGVVSPFLFFQGLCLQRPSHSLSRCFLLLGFFFRVAVITLQLLPPLPSFVRSSQAAPNKVLSVLSVVVGAGASTLLAILICAFFFHFGGGRPLHKVQSFILCIPFEIPSSCFTNSRPKAFLSRSSDVLSILRRSNRLAPDLFIRSLPRSYCFRPQFLVRMLHSGPFQRLILDVRPFGILGATLPLSYLLRSCPLCCAASARWVTSLRATANSFRDPQFPWDRIFLASFLYRNATFAGRDTFLQAAGDCLLDPLFLPQFLAALRGQIADPTPLPRFYDKYYCGILLGRSSDAPL
jgi:hypothetical protein